MNKTLLASKLISINQNLERSKREVSKWELLKFTHQKKMMDLMELDHEKTYKNDTHKFSIRVHRGVTEVEDLLAFMQWFKKNCPDDKENFEKLFTPTKRELGSFIRKYLEGVDAIESVLAQIDGIKHEIKHQTLSVREL